jgi:methyl-accepting chemotaxis protein
MKEVVNSIKRVNDIMADIAAASAEQSQGIQEVSTAVSQMDEMTQQNAALVEEAAAAAESLQSQANQLTQRVAVFQVNSYVNDALPTPVVRTVMAKPSVKSIAKTTTKKLLIAKPQDEKWETF